MRTSEQQHIERGRRFSPLARMQGSNDGPSAATIERAGSGLWFFGIGAVVAGALAILMRWPMWGAPLTPDEGGYGQIARLWGRGRTLYEDVWVDRPQGLLLIFRGIAHIGDSPYTMRVVAAAAAATAVLLLMLIARQLAGNTVAVIAGLLMASVGASPYLESFTLSGELLAMVPALLSLLAFTRYIATRQLRWVFLAGLLTGCAVMVKQSAFDAGLAEAAYLLWTERRRAGRPLAALLVGIAMPVAACAASAPNIGDWWYAVVTYRFEVDSAVSGSYVERLSMFADTLPFVLVALALLIVLTIRGWRASHILARLWLPAAAICAIGGGQSHLHYYQQLVPPLALIAASGLVRIVTERRTLSFAAASVFGAIALVLSASIWLETPNEQAKSIWPKDLRLTRDGAVAQWVQDHSNQDDTILVIWANAQIYYLADREPAIRYLWRRNLEGIPNAIDDAHDALARGRPSLVIVAYDPARVDRSGGTEALLRRRYERVATVEGFPVYRPQRA
jgi:4-amino-4-deoxy-L-arabinose transferase-like glycosyltransferase